MDGDFDLLFDGISDEDLLPFVNEQENISTRRKIDSDVNLLKQFVK